MEKLLAPLRMRIFWVDMGAMFIFALLARIFHGGFDVGQIFTTFWPFALGVYLSWVLQKEVQQRPLRIDMGVRVWLITLATGLVIWFLRHMRMPHISFLVVAPVMSALMILGWRAVVLLLARK